MKKLSLVLAVVFGLFTQVALAADVKIAVVDVRSGVMTSEEAKLKMEKLKGEFAQEKANLEALQMEIKKMEEKAQKDGAVMSMEEKRKLEKEAMEKVNELKFKGQQFQQSSQQEAQEVFQSLLPKFQKALKAVIDEQKLDLVIAREAALMVKPDLDITKAVTDKMNTIKE
ncbi:MAG: OmpH family outer membrane protein [Pseudomonadales bacterium]|nr:OmpH family outer membrane protein [Pseudomonadales bacterium]